MVAGEVGGVVFSNGVTSGKWPLALVINQPATLMQATLIKLDGSQTKRHENRRYTWEGGLH